MILTSRFKIAGLVLLLGLLSQCAYAATAAGTANAANAAAVAAAVGTSVPGGETDGSNIEQKLPAIDKTIGLVPVMMDAGYYNFDGTSSTWVGTFNTDRLCPNSYSPYIVFIPNITFNPDGGRAILITFRSITKNASSYSVSFNKQYGQDSGGIAFTWMMYCFPAQIPVPSYLPYGGGF